MLEYDPTRPWVAKYRLSDGKIACDMLIYIDDLRLTGPTSDECGVGQLHNKWLVFVIGWESRMLPANEENRARIQVHGQALCYQQI
jgi:hypothetical protein